MYYVTVKNHVKLTGLKYETCYIHKDIFETQLMEVTRKQQLHTSTTYIIVNEQGKLR